MNLEQRLLVLESEIETLRRAISELRQLYMDKCMHTPQNLTKASGRSISKLLRATRRGKGMTIEAMSLKTGIPTLNIEYLEKEVGLEGINDINCLLGLLGYQLTIMTIDTPSGI